MRLWRERVVYGYDYNDTTHQMVFDDILRIIVHHSYNVALPSRIRKVFPYLSLQSFSVGHIYVV